MIEEALVIVKPYYANFPKLIEEVIKELDKNNIQIVFASYFYFSPEEVEIHYIKHKEKNFFHELKDYYLSDKLFGIHVCGEEIITKTRNLVEILRTKLKEKFSLKTDVMMNILHCTSKTKQPDGTLIDEDSEREINNFYHAINRQTKKAD